MIKILFRVEEIISNFLRTLVFKAIAKYKHHSLALRRLYFQLKPAHNRLQDLSCVLDVVAQILFCSRRVHEPVEASVLNRLLFHYFNVEPGQYFNCQHCKIVWKFKIYVSFSA